MIQPPRVVDLGRCPYEDAYRAQVEHVEAVQAARAAGTPEAGRILLVEHDPVITIGRHLGAERHLLASQELLASRGVALVESDRGGDITYHGPGQLVAYPILDLNLLNLGLHDYMRLLEASVIDACAAFGVRGERDPSATGVWVSGAGLLPGEFPSHDSAGQLQDSAPPARTAPRALAKLCAFGVRVRRWVSMHGLALNVTTNLDHFGLIVPCGLAGRPVTSLARLLGDSCPPMDAVKHELVNALTRRIVSAAAIAEARRASAARPA